MKKTGNGRFKDVTFPVWFQEAEIKVAEKILGDNPELTPYSAMLFASDMCNKDHDAASHLLKRDAIIVDIDNIPATPKIVVVDERGTRSGRWVTQEMADRIFNEARRGY